MEQLQVALFKKKNNRRNMHITLSTYNFNIIIYSNITLTVSTTFY